MFDDIPVYPLETPALRNLDIVPVQTEKGQFLMIQDPVGLLEGPALMQPDPLLMVFLQLADGKTTVGEMAQQLTMQTGQIISAGIFESVAKQMDEALLLQSEAFVEALRNKYTEFMASPTRPYKTFMTKPGTDRLAALKEIADEFRRHKMSSLSPPKEIDLPANSVIGVLAPHIDYQRGGEAYAWAYETLKQAGTNAKTYIILGTCHQPTLEPFIATKKDYDTPLGKLETNVEMLEELEQLYGSELYEEEYLHMDEHTIELNATYLKQTFQDRDVKIIPILVGSLEEMLHTDESPENDEKFSKFCAALGQLMDKYGDDVALIGGVDFSHCGPQFGDEQLNDEARENEIEKGDQEALAAVEAMDSKGFFEHFRPDQNARKVCSVSTIYTVLKTLTGKAKARKLSYQQANSNDKSNLVSFASVAFLKEGMEDKPKSKIILLG